MAKNLGEFELLVLLSLIRLSPQAYGVVIGEDITDRTGRKITIGALYATLNRLETKAYVKTRMGETSPARGGRAKRYYEITPLGQKQVEQTLSSLKNMLPGTQLWPET